MDLRKWQVFNKTVTRIDKLTEEQLVKQKEQKELLAKGEVVPEADLIKDPEPYQVEETFCQEFESEGKEYENFLLMFKPEYAEQRADKWKAKLRKLMPVLTNGEEVVEGLIKNIDDNVNFWKTVKENPEAQVNNEAMKEHPRFLEFTCKALQRVLELGVKTEDELEDMIEAVKPNKEKTEKLEESIEKTQNNLAQDIVQRRQNRFQLIEAKVKEIQDSTKEIHISMVDLDKLLIDIKRELANTEQFQKLEFSPDQIRYFLHVSQFLFLKAMITSMVNRKAFEYQKDFGIPSYQNVVLLDFSDLISQVNDFREDQALERSRIHDELIEKFQREQEANPSPEGQENTKKVPKLDEVEIPVKSHIKAITRNLNLL